MYEHTDGSPMSDIGLKVNLNRLYFFFIIIAPLCLIYLANIITDFNIYLQNFLI